jgi:hypothetical protein
MDEESSDIELFGDDQHFSGEEGTQGNGLPETVSRNHKLVAEALLSFEFLSKKQNLDLPSEPLCQSFSKSFFGLDLKLLGFRADDSKFLYF